MSIDNFQTCLSKANAVPQYIIWETYSPCSSKGETCSPKCLKVCIANIGRRIVFAVEKTFHGITKVGNFASFISKWYESFWKKITLWKAKNSQKNRLTTEPFKRVLFRIFPVSSMKRIKSLVRSTFLLSFALLFPTWKKNQKDIFRKMAKSLFENRSIPSSSSSCT